MHSRLRQLVDDGGVVGQYRVANACRQHRPDAVPVGERLIADGGWRVVRNVDDLRGDVVHPERHRVSSAARRGHLEQAQRSPAAAHAVSIQTSLTEGDAGATEPIVICPPVTSSSAGTTTPPPPAVSNQVMKIRLSAPGAVVKVMTAPAAV